MLAPTTAELMLYSTVKLTALQHGNPISTGTGFFFAFAPHGDQSLPAIVTNKHVVNGSSHIMMNLHIDQEGRPSGKFTRCDIQMEPGRVVSHPDANVDLCAIFIGDILQQSAAAATPIFLTVLDLGLIPPEEDWQYFDAIETVTMIGCPRGISDDTNNLPIVRRGITATSLSKEYNGKSEFMVDMACFPGSSGSPIFLHDSGGYLDRKENTYKMGSSRLHLLGILYGGPQITNNGQIILAQPPKVSVAAMMHLGNAIRSVQLRILDAEVGRIVPLQIPSSER